ncbi:MAG: hypothetical protein FI718_02130 [SAR202 cluster bacterium]|nr:hypothetical protein [SAR202 cluster bacterium]|tara:strand:+ start:6187 stop:7008 length:822 start_codon:yes stop_codon:yes gene_type:complete
MKSRIATASIGIPILAGVIFVGGIWFSISVLLLAVIGTLELNKLLNNIGLKTSKVMFLISVCSIVILSHFLTIEKYDEYHLLTLIIVLVTIPLVWQIQRFKSGTSIVDWVATYFMVICFGGGLAHGILLINLDNGVYLACWLVSVVMASDMAAFFVGRRFGKHKLAPNISPMKTVEGAIAGVVGAILISLAIYYIFTKLEIMDLNFSIITAVIGGLLVGSIGIIGDLGESKLKRMAGVKDAGTVFPGHGGVLDRLDSVLFNLPIAYYGVVWIS